MNYAWFIWSLIILGLWGVVYWGKLEFRKEMWKMSWWTMFFGLSEPFFVPEYWFPPSLFDLANKTGFDIESLLFSFAIGGIGVVLYRLVFPSDLIPIQHTEKSQQKHQLHKYILFTPIIIAALVGGFTSLNPIYIGVIALFFGGLATLYCRPDLRSKTWIGGLLFTGLYIVYFGSLLLVFPDYVELYWNLDALTGILLLGIPLEELMFAFTFGMYLSGLYEHLFWYQLKTINA